MITEVEFQKLSVIVFGQLKNLSADLIYHNAGHTQSVIKRAEEIFRLEKLTEEQDLFILKTAALFHDTGFLKAYDGHEVESCRNAAEVLKKSGTDHSDILKVQQLIMATHLPQKPGTHLGEVMCDADVYYLGTDKFDEYSEKLFEEWENFGIIKSREEFNIKQLHFLEGHYYFTSSAKRLLGKKKKENLKNILVRMGH